MLVKAKCTSRAWDSRAAVLCCPGEFYEIEHDGPLAGLKIGSGYVFEFDRGMSSTSAPASPVKEITPSTMGEALPPDQPVVSAPLLKVDRRGLGPRTCNCLLYTSDAADE